MNPYRIPALPPAGIEHDFRQQPTRISARAVYSSWSLYEFAPAPGREIWVLDASATWKIIYSLGVRLVRALDGRTIAEAGLARIAPGDLGGAILALQRHLPWRRPQPRLPRGPARAARETTPAAGKSLELTERERQILELLCDGHSFGAAAARLGIARRTVESHCLNLSQKVGIRPRALLVRWAIREGIIEA